MDAISQSLLTFLLLYKYTALFLITFVAALAVPIPSGAITVAAFFFASQGYMSTPLVALANVAGNVAGDWVGYWLSRLYGKKVLRKIGLGRVIDSVAVRALDKRIAEHPWITIFVTRFATAITPLANLVAGMAPLPWRTFMLADILGEASETGLNLVYGIVFGSSWTYFSSLTGKIGLIVVIVVALIILIYWKKFWRRNHHAKVEA